MVRLAKFIVWRKEVGDDKGGKNIVYKIFQRRWRDEK
jgi:hypothetical protein